MSDHYAYDTAGNVTEVTDDNGAKVVYTYDVYSRLISQSVETGEEPITTSFTYDAMGNLTEVDGYEYTYDKNGNVVRVQTPEGAEVRYTYDADNRLIKTEETVWEDTLTVYKNAARLNTVSGTDGEKLYPGNELICEVVLETENGADTFEIIVLYDKERLTFDSYAAKQSGIRVSDDGNGTLVITTTWGLAGGKRALANLSFKAKEMAEGTAYVAVSPESTVTKGKNTHAVSECSGVLAELHLPDYNEDGITDLRDFAILAGMYGKDCGDEGWQASYDITGDGQVTEKDLDFIRNMIFAGLLGAGDIPEEQVSDHNYLPRYEITRQQKVRTTTYTYNASGDVTEITDCNGNQVTYEYDSCGRVVSIIDAAGAKSTLEYDQMGNPTKVILPEGVTETYTYDSEGRVLTVTDALGATVTYTYDTYGRVKAVTDAVGVCTEYEYDIAGNVTKNLLTGEEYVYNVYGEIVSYTDAEGNTTAYTYDGQGNVTNVTDALGSVTRYTYRKDGLLATIEDASGAVTSYAYNVRGLVESETDPLGAVTSYQYDKEDRVVRVTEPNGTVTEYEYNTDGNVTSITATKEDGQASVLRYLYAMDGSLTASISDTDILTYKYDAMGQVTELNKNGIHTLGFGYDSNGNLLWLKESTNSNLNNPDTVTAYTYDLAGRLTEVRTGGSSKYELAENYHDGSKNFRERFTGGTLLAEYTYNVDGTLKTMTDGAGSITTYSYTNYKQVAEMGKVSADGSLLYREVNTYDGNGSLLSRIIEGSVVVGSSAEAEYTYDALDRLISEVVDGMTTTYTYDVMGNRLTKNVDGVVTEYSYDLCNKLLSEVTENPAEELVTTYGYDSVGNLTEKVTPEGTVTYEYDALSQLTNVTNSDGTWQSSTYDASGIRSMLSENGITTEYVSFNGLVLAGYDKNAEQTEQYYYGTSLLAIESTNGITNANRDVSTSLYHYIQNSHGDVIGLTDNNGTLTETYTYDAFGTLTYIQSLNEDGVLTQTETALSRFLYAGEQYDEVAGLYYLRARRYDTTVGRFTQEDTYLGDGRNLYVYVQNNPLKYVDPSGYCSDKKTGYTGSTDYLGYYSMYDPSNPVKVNEPGLLSHGDPEEEYIERVKNSYGMGIWDAFDENSDRATNDFAIGFFYEIAYLATFGYYQDPSAEEVYYQDAFQAGRDFVDFITVLPNLYNMAASLSNQFANTKAPASSTTLTTTSQNTSLIVIDQGLNVVTAPSFYPIESGINSIKSLDDLVADPSKLAGVSPKELYDYLIKNGYDVQSLSKGSYKGVPFNEGGGFKVNWGGDRILQYHPESLSHHGGAYYKISSGETGTIRMDLDGNMIK